MELFGKKIFVFGGTGSLGRALIRNLCSNNQLFLFSRDEAKHWTIKNQLSNRDMVEFIVGDIRDGARVEASLIKYNPDVIIIASALKQVDTCELSPSESVQTNILGIQNVVNAVINRVDRLTNLDVVLLVSTDKACAPANVYGMCKAVAERLITSSCLGAQRPRFVAVRYGNVLESRGSIIPLFRYQADFHPSFSVTHADMTRFIMTLDESIKLITATIKEASSGEIWLPKLRSMKILDLAQIFSERFNKPIKFSGIRPGEKLHEDLVSRPESIRVRDEDGYYKMSPAHSIVSEDARIFSYASDHDVLSKIQLAVYLDQLGIFTRSMDQFIGREIEEIKTI